jgi:hypothetical protein
MVPVNASTSKPWRKPPEALKESVAHHLRLTNEKQNKQTYYVHRHHFLLIGWEYSSQKTKCIDATTA